MKTKWVLILAMVLALGCSREIDTNVTYIDGEFTLYATSGENETKTVLQQDGSVFWSPSDCIKVFYGNIPGKFTSTNTAPAASAEFTGSLGSFVMDGVTEFVAAYPFSDYTLLSGNQLSIGLPNEQVAVEGTFADDLFICAAKSKDVHLHFYNVCGGVKFSLARDDIKKVVFRGNDNESLAGRMAVEFDSSGIPQVTGLTDGHSSVTLTAPDGGTFKKGSWYYLVLIPQALSQGYTVELYADELAETISSDSSVTVRRSAWGVLKELGTVPSSVDVPGAVDLGLPSGLLWAACNLGATRPEEYGDYFAWGETEPYYSSFDPLGWKSGKESGYLWQSYIWSKGSGKTLTKYCTDSNFGYNGFTDGKTLLDLEDDAAHMILGGLWRMPTKEEQSELLTNCSWEWETINGVKCQKVTGPNGNYIYLPAAGNLLDTHMELDGRYGVYWSSSLEVDSPDSVCCLDFPKNVSSWLYYYYRYCGFSIRPVYGEPAFIPVERVSLDKSEQDLVVGETTVLVATITPSNATDRSVTWSSSEESVASVSSSGVVTAISVGSTTITVSTTDGGKVAACMVTVKAGNDHEWVDLGLPSGLLWATCNVGASSPEDLGDSFAWGETEPKNNFGWYNYQWCSGSYTSITKYNNYSFYGVVDNKTRLEMEDDAARANWKGTWRMPTIEEFSELRNSDNCKWTWTTLGTASGYQVTSKKNGNSIFLPARRKDVSGMGYYYEGIYWSASLYTGEADKAMELYFLADECHDNYVSYRYNGHSVRPVNDELTIHVQEILLDRTELVLLKGEDWTLKATVLPENAVNKGVRWSSGDESVATVSSNGVVSGVDVGTAMITATTYDGNKTATCVVQVTENQSNDHQWVDLGLPSGTKWATCNVGASRPEEFGDYFAWAETEPKTDYSWKTYKWYDLSTYSFTKYGTYSKLSLDDDAARANWGGAWKIPAQWDFEELVNYCSWEWTTMGEVDGYWITSKSNGNGIFLPAAGYWNSTGFSGGAGHYWTSYTSSDPDKASCLFFVSHTIYKYDSSLRWNGCSVRPIVQ